MPVARPMTITEAARELAIDVRTVQRDIACGLPVVRRGRRGRGCPTLIDLGTYRAWREKSAAAATELALLAIAADLPDLLAQAIDETFRGASGAHKRAIARDLAGAWYRCSTALLDRLRREVPTLPELDAVPESISRLRRI